MDPQLLIPSQATNFNFEISTHTAKSPKDFNQNVFYSAPTSPKQYSSTSFDHQDSFASSTTSCVVEDEKLDDASKEEFNYDLDFAFDFSGQLESPLISAADELFQGGKIKPLDPQQPPMSKTYAKQQHLIKPYKLHSPKNILSQNQTKHKASRSLSPVRRVSDILIDDHQKASSSSTTTTTPFGFMWYNKWNLKNLLLFRSTSEGSAMISKDSKSTSFRSNDGGGSVTGGSSRRMKRKVSAHEMHYTANRAVAEGMKRKTYLPYKSGLLGCLGFGYSHNNNNSIHETSFRGRSS